MEADVERQVRELVAEGRHAQAAALCAEAGEVERAADLFAAVWRWDDAIAVTEGAGRFDAAYRHALAARDRGASGRLLAALEQHPAQARVAAGYAEAKGLYADAARLREGVGETEQAAALYEKAGELRDAARCLLTLGEARNAGLLYERCVREDPDDAQSALALGRILAQFGRWDHAVRALQRAAEAAETRVAALRLLVACFSAMGMDEAAGSRLDALREVEPELPLRVPEMLQVVFGDARGLAGVVGGAASEEYLAGRYRITRTLGAGAVGRVLLAFDAFHERDVAIKVLQVGGGSLGRDAFVRFAREARVAAGISHPNVVQVFEFNPDGPFLVMEYMAGGTLADRLVGPDEAPIPLAPPRVWALAKAVLAALEAVHRRGVVHRDLKPANVFYDAAGNVKLGDFGVAHLTDLGATLTGAMMGTLAYMAPEQITGSQRPNAATDLYAMGVILFRCLTGMLPFPGPDFVAQHLHDTPPRLREVAPWLPEALDAVVSRLLAKDPGERFASANDLVAALRPVPWDRLEAPDDAPSVPPRRDSLPPPASVPDTRYRRLGHASDARSLAHDELLQRDVELVGLAPDHLERFRAFARADGPHLQAVYALDEGAGLAILEAPRGAPLDSLPCDDPRRAAVLRDVRAALTRLHENGVAHGSVDGAHILVGPARACLRWAPARPGAEIAADLEALDQLEG